MMTTFFSRIRLLATLLSLFLLIVIPLACVDPEDLSLFGTVDVLVVDGTINNLAEPQEILLNRSKADRLTGRFGSLPITKALVEVVVDSAQVIACHETVAGTYQLPGDFRGQIGHAYQLRITLSDGTHYLSTQQIMQSVPPIDAIKAQFNPTGLTTKVNGIYPAAHDISIDFKDPADQHNYYRWDWKLWEKQDWCKSCVQGEYAQYNIVGKGVGTNCYVGGNQLYEDCFSPPEITMPEYNYGGQNLYFVYDYNCRTQCWEILYSHAIDVFDDKFSNGGTMTGRRVAQIPFYQKEGCLVEIRQLALTADAYRFFLLFQQQTQNTGGLTDTPPSALVGNVRNIANAREKVVGYFTAAAASAKRYWIDRKDATGTYPGLFYAQNGRPPIPEPDAAKFCIAPLPLRPPKALCVPSNTKTPFKPDGWQE
ncbi:DUF4249 domain-containing protein [Spirosoma foliorum]|nr:DUF4249 domain-containing protein [Spirosoma foliorum]